jgi:osmotically-inducible protein OsmY
MRSDSEIERDVREELKWDPDLNADDIAVSVKNGVVTLAGFVPSYSDRLEAEAAAKRVAGVLAVANDLEFGCRRSISVPILILRGMRVEGRIADFL